MATKRRGWLDAFGLGDTSFGAEGRRASCARGERGWTGPIKKRQGDDGMSILSYRDSSREENILSELRAPARGKAGNDVNLLRGEDVRRKQKREGWMESQ